MFEDGGILLGDGSALFEDVLVDVAAMVVVQDQLLVQLDRGLEVQGLG